MTTILVPYHLDEHLPGLDTPAEPTRTITLPLPDGDLWQRISALYDPVADAVAESVRHGERPTVMSGDCTTSFATVAGLQRAGADPAIVWFDAHGDAQTLETTTSGYLGGMPLRMLAGYGRALVAERIGLRDVPEDRILLVDARDLDPPEIDYLDASAIGRATVDEIASGAAALPEGPLYLHVDFDVVNPADLPGLLFPAAGGPALDAVGQAIRRVLGTGRVAAFGAACTWHPGHGAADRVRPYFATPA